MAALWYILDKDGNPVPTNDIMAVERLLGNQAARTVGCTKVGGIMISTVFLCLDHGMGTRKPTLYETMVFYEDGSQADFTEKDLAQKGSELLFGFDLFGSRRRYETREEAIVGHRETVRLVASCEGGIAEEVKLEEKKTFFTVEYDGALSKKVANYVEVISGDYPHAIEMKAFPDGWGEWAKNNLLDYAGGEGGMVKMYTVIKKDSSGAVFMFFKTQKEKDAVCRAYAGFVSKETPFKLVPA